MMQTRSARSTGSPLAELQELLSGVFEDLVDAVPVGEARFPRMELRRTEEGYRLYAEVPGVPRDALELSVENGVLSLEGERPAPEVPAGAEPIRRERPAGRFRRTVRLPEDVDAERVQARLERGVLMVELPRPPARQPREITIEVEERT